MITKLQFFFSENTSKEQKNNLKEKIEAMDGVVSVTYISSDEMWNQLKSSIMMKMMIQQKDSKVIILYLIVIVWK